MNPARALLKKHVDRMIANGSPVIAEIPAWHGTNAPLVLPSGQVVDSGITLDDYESRVESLENEGCDRSDAQGIVDAQLLRSLELIPIGSNLPVNVCHESCAGDGGIPITLSFSIKCF